MVVYFSPPPHFHLSKKMLLVAALEKGTCPRKVLSKCGGGTKVDEHGNINTRFLKIIENKLHDYNYYTGKMLVIIFHYDPHFFCKSYF